MVCHNKRNGEKRVLISAQSGKEHSSLWTSELTMTNLSCYEAQRFHHYQAQKMELYDWTKNVLAVMYNSESCSSNAPLKASSVLHSDQRNV